MSLLRGLKILEISTTRYYSWKKNPDKEDKRKTPNRKGIITNPQLQMALSPEERQKIIDLLKDPKYADLSVEQVRLKALDDTGLYIASARTFARVAKKEGLTGKRPYGSVRPVPEGTERCAPLVADKPNEVWVWDISLLPFASLKGNCYQQQTAYFFAVMDLYSRKIVHNRVYADQSAQSAKQFFKDAFAINGIPEWTHSDNGSAMRSEELLELFNDNNVKVSFSRPRHSNDNPHMESFFGTAKGPMNMSFQGCHSIEECSQHADEYIRLYNEERCHSGINFVTPSSRYENQDEEILKKRQMAQQRHFDEHPERYINKRMRDYSKAGSQHLNDFSPPRVWKSKSRKNAG